MKENALLEMKMLEYVTSPMRKTPLRWKMIQYGPSLMETSYQECENQWYSKHIGNTITHIT